MSEPRARGNRLAEERERLRDRRRERETQQDERQRRLMLLGGGVTLLALCGVAALIAVGQSGDAGVGEVEGAAEVTAHLEGIPQRGTTLGEPDAKATVVEFGDLQCPACKEYSAGVVASLIEGPVREGRAKLEFRNWVILGPQSGEAAKAALAAGEQGRFWNFIELFYRNQGIEHSGYVTGEFLRSIATGAGVPDLARWERDRTSARWDPALTKTSRQAQNLGFTGTPSFLVVGPSGAEPLGTPHSAAEIEAAISRAG